MYSEPFVNPFSDISDYVQLSSRIWNLLGEGGWGRWCFRPGRVSPVFYPWLLSPDEE